MSQKDITLRQGHATPATIILRALEAPPSPTTTIYLYEFHPTPSTVVLGDPTTVRVSGDPTPVTYEFTGNMALTFAVASDVDFGDVQPTDVALTLAVSSPQAATYAHPVSIALTFTVASAYEFVAGSVEEETPSTGGSGGGSGSSGASFPWVRPPRRPVVYEFVGSVAMPKWKVSSWVYGPRYPAHDVMVAAVQWAPEHSPAVIQIPKRSLRVTQMAEEDELLLIGAL